MDRPPLSSHCVDSKKYQDVDRALPGHHAADISLIAMWHESRDSRSQGFIVNVLHKDTVGSKLETNNKQDVHRHRRGETKKSDKNIMIPDRRVSSKHRDSVEGVCIVITDGQTKHKTHSAVLEIVKQNVEPLTLNTVFLDYNA